MTESDSSSDFGDDSPFGGVLTGGGDSDVDDRGELESFFAPSSTRARRSDKGWVPSFAELCSGSPVYTFSFVSKEGKPFARVAAGSSEGGDGDAYETDTDEETARRREAGGTYRCGSPDWTGQPTWVHLETGTRLVRPRKEGQGAGAGAGGGGGGGGASDKAKTNALGRVTVSVGDGTPSDDGATQHTVYDASMVLAGFLWKQASRRAASGFAASYLGAGTRTLELGAGTGLVSLLLAHCLPAESSPSRVVATDLETCVKFTDANAERMARIAGDGARVECLPLHWGRDVVGGGSGGDGGGTAAAAATTTGGEAAAVGAIAETVAARTATTATTAAAAAAGSSTFTLPSTLSSLPSSSLSSTTTKTSTHFDLILCSDLLYTPTLFLPLLETLHAHCRPLEEGEEGEGGEQGPTLAGDGDAQTTLPLPRAGNAGGPPPSLVLFSFERRGFDVRWDEFFDLAQTEEFGFRICDIPVEALHERFREVGCDGGEGEVRGGGGGGGSRGRKERVGTSETSERSRKSARGTTSSSIARDAKTGSSGTQTLPRIKDMPVSSIVFRAMVRVCSSK